MSSNTIRLGFSMEQEVLAETNKVPDVDVIMQRIREEVRRGVQPTKQGSAAFAARSASEAESSLPSTLLYAEELHYLNANWHNWNAGVEITSHRRILGPFIVRIKKKLIDVAWKYLLKDYFERERAFHMNLVRHLNATARYIDSRDKDIFWQLIKKIDVEVLGLYERIELLESVTNCSLERQGQNIAENEQRGAQAVVQLRDELARRLTEVEDVARGLERTVSLLSQAPSESDDSGESGGSPPQERRVFSSDGAAYLLLENRYRGSEEVIKERQRDYLSLFADLPGPVLELGSGRGEFLELLAEAGIAAKGIDLDPAMIARCREKGLSVEEGDCISYLQALEDNSLGGIFAAQLVEHLERPELESLIRLSQQKLASGGILVLETINPQSFVALARNFFRDPTHVWPLHPETLRYMLEMQGLKTREVLLRSPYPESALLRKLETTDYLPPRWNVQIASLNQTIDQLNELLFGYQDYAVVGVCP